VYIIQSSCRWNKRREQRQRERGSVEEKGEEMERLKSDKIDWSEVGLLIAGVRKKFILRRIH